MHDDIAHLLYLLYLLILFLATPAVDRKSVITLTGPSTVCYGNEYQLICNHPDMSKTNDYLKTVYWKKNGFDLIHHAMERSVTIDTTATALNITVTKETFINKENVYNCFLIHMNTSMEEISNDLKTTILGIPEPNVTIQSRIYEMSLKLTHTVQGCYRDVSYSITLTFNNGSFNYNRLHNTTAQEYTITELEPSTNYSVIVIAFSREDPDIHSNSVAVETATLEPIDISISQGTVCYGQSVDVSCYNGNLRKNRQIYRETDPTILFLNNDTCSLDSDHTKTIDVLAEGSNLEDGKIEIFCGIVYADGNIEKSIKKIVEGTYLFSPAKLNAAHQSKSISLSWEYYNNCSLSMTICTFMYEVTWRQSGDGSSLRSTTTTETSYTIEGLTPGTSYEIGVGAYCKENTTIKSRVQIGLFQTLPAPDNMANILPVIAAPVTVIVIAIIIVVIIVWRCRKKKNNLKIQN